MAVQLHVAFSKTFSKGAGIISGGPYLCANYSLLTGMGRCMQNKEQIPLAELVEITRSWGSEGKIDSLSFLASSRVYLFSSTGDIFVNQTVMDDLKKYYQHFISADNIFYKNDINFAHAFITDNYGNPCRETKPPFLNNCGYDTAGHMLDFIYGKLNPRNTGELLGKLIEFNQRQFTTISTMGATGFVYVPSTCRSGQNTFLCKVVVALHGCQQNKDQIEDVFARHAGYNEWADTNNMVVLYPQTGVHAFNGCWDWWAATGSDYAQQSGVQMKAIKAMLDHLSTILPSGETTCYSISLLVMGISLIASFLLIYYKI